MKEENLYLVNTPIKKLLIKFAVPCVLAMLVSALYNIVDQIFIGIELGTTGNYAITVVFPFTVVALAFAMMIGEGCASLFSISLGAKDEKTSQKSVGNAILLVVFCAVILTALGYAIKDPILNLCGVTEFSYELTNTYYLIVLAGFPFYMITQTVSSIIRADGSPKYSMMAALVGAIINIALDPILIFVFKMGIAGAAVATIVGQVISAIVCLVYFRKPKLVKLQKDSWKPDFKVMGSICKLGLSSFITQFSITVITIVANNVVRAISVSSGYGDASGPGGVLGVVFKVFGIVMAFCNGVALGGLPIIGYNYGAKQNKRVLEALKYILIVNVIIGVIATILFEACPQIFGYMFGIEQGKMMNFLNMSFRIYLGGILLCCLQKASCIFLQAINKPYKAMTLSLMRDVICLVPGVCLFGLLGNLELMLWAGLVADGLSFIVTIIFVLIEVKKLKKPIPVDEKAGVAPSNLVVTIGREFGSGGKFIGEELAKRLGVKCYDKELLNEVAKNYNIDLKTLEELDEKQEESFWYGFATNYVFKAGEVLPVSAEDNLFLKQAKIIEELYQKESCVIIGRCSNVILKNKPNVINVFVYSSDKELKVQRKMEFEKLSREEAIEKIQTVDKQRGDYYKHFTGLDWGDKSGYNLSVDVAEVGVENAVNLIFDYIQKAQDKKDEITEVKTKKKSKKQENHA